MKVTSHTCSPTWVTPTFWPADERPATIFTSRPTKGYGLVNMALPATVFSAGTSSCRTSQCSTIRSPSNRKMSAAISVLPPPRSEEHTSELQSQSNLVCRLLLEKKNKEESARLPATDPVRGSLIRLLAIHDHCAPLVYTLTFGSTLPASRRQPEHRHTTHPVHPI